jgi:hypothetical protein
VRSGRKDRKGFEQIHAMYIKNRPDGLALVPQTVDNILSIFEKLQRLLFVHETDPFFFQFAAQHGERP